MNSVRLERFGFKSNSVTYQHVTSSGGYNTYLTVLSLGINERMHKDYHSKLPDVDNVKHMLLKKVG